MARTLKEFSETLEKKVKERTNELVETKNVAEQKTTDAEQKTKEAEKKKEKLEKFYRLIVGREIKMGKLKEKIRELEEKLKIQSD